MKEGDLVGRTRMSSLSLRLPHSHKSHSGVPTLPAAAAILDPCHTLYFTGNSKNLLWGVGGGHSQPLDVSHWIPLMTTCGSKAYGGMHKRGDGLKFQAL